MGGNNTSVVDVVTSVLVNFTQKYAVNNNLTCLDYSNLSNIVDISGENVKIKGTFKLTNKSQEKKMCLLDTKTLMKAVLSLATDIINTIEQEIKSGIFDSNSEITEAVKKIVNNFTQENEITNSISSNIRRDMQNSITIWARNSVAIDANMVFNNYLLSYSQVINKAVSDIVNDLFSDIKDLLTNKSIIKGFDPMASLFIIFLIVAVIAYIILKFMVV